MRYKRVIILFFLGLFFTTNLWAITAPFIDDMEGIDDNGWTLDPLDPLGPPDTNDWERGEPNPAGNPSPYPPSLPLVHPSRTNCWGTNLSGQYTKNRTSRLISPEIDVGSGNTPFLSCYLWYKIAADDYATVEVKTVSATEWDTLESIPQNSNSGGWVKRVYNLSGYSNNIQVRFSLTSDNSNATRDLGLYIDDVAVGTNYDTQDRYIIAIEPEPSPVSTTILNDMTVRVEARDLFKYIDNATNEVTIQTVQDGPNDSSLSQITPSPVYLSGGKATFTFRDTERENVTFAPSVTISGQSLTSISTIGKFLSPFRKSWEEKE